MQCTLDTDWALSWHALPMACLFSSRKPRDLKPIDIPFLNLSVQASITSLLLVLLRYLSTDLATS